MLGKGFERSLDRGWKVGLMVEQNTSSIRGATDSAQRELELLREYRTRLTADVVTGKLVVLASAARLLDEADGPELLDESEAERGAEESSTSDTDVEPEEAEA